MEVKDLYPFILMLVGLGMLLGVGLLLFDKFDVATRSTASYTDTNLNISTAPWTATKNYCVAVSSVANWDNGTTYDATTYGVTVNAGYETCYLQKGTLPAQGKYNITYTYKLESQASNAIVDVRDATTPISTTWLALIVTVVILAIIMGIVITSFTGQRR